ncbi:hypothetical protein IGI04_024114 [Brassica rapa subsp. trilocularis]|uniref:Uncharacterized protein n=1 Tax=Brassica rapa subsp. trilocularis TaxID=1813537 RepID=A0ABQ7M868_BRACM|nr:hypothetical protein IGI04_024114 [Brassica rapa subsp. trilocularis]
MASMVTAASPSRSRPPPDPPPSFAVFVVVFGASPLKPKPSDDSPLAIVQPSTAFEGFVSDITIFPEYRGYISTFSSIGIEFR